MNTTTKTVKKLSELIVGETARIKEYLTETTETLRLQEMGLLPGTLVTAIRKTSANYSLKIQVKGYHLALRKEEADLIHLGT